MNKELLNHPNRFQPNRRDFLITSMVIGLVAELYIIREKWAELNRAISFRIEEERGIQATDFARPIDISEELETIPESLYFSALRIDIQNPITDKGISGSATIIDTASFPGIGLILTAGHVIKNIGDSYKSRLKNIILSQPQIDPEKKLSVNKYFAVADPDGKDIGVLAFKLDEVCPFNPIGIEKIDPDWIPNTDETLFSLSFPGSATKHHEVFPSYFRLSSIHADASGINMSFTGYATDSVVGWGSSGGGVVTKDGKLIGVLSHSNPNKKINIICPIGDEFPVLVKNAINGLLSSY